MREGLQRIDLEGEIAFLGLGDAHVLAVALGRRVDAVTGDEALGGLAPGHLDPLRTAAHRERADALRRLQEVIDGELFLVGVVDGDVIAGERDRQRRFARGLDLGRAVGGERELELAAAVDVDQLLGAIGGGEHIEAVVAVEGEAMDGFIAAAGAEALAPFACRREDLHQVRFVVADVDVARRVGGHRDRPGEAALLRFRLGRIADLVHQDAIAREDLHPAVAGVGDVEVVGEVQAADVGELAVARAAAADGEFRRAVVGEDLDAVAVDDGDLARVVRGATRPLELGGERRLQLAGGVEARHRALARVEAEQVAVDQGVEALAFDRHDRRAPHARQALGFRGRGRRFRDAEELDLLVADVGDRQVASGDRQRRDLGELAAAAPGAAEFAQRHALFPVEHADVVVAAVGDEQAAGEVGGQRAPACVLAARHRLRRQALEHPAAAVVDRDAAIAGLLEHVDALGGVDRDLHRLRQRDARVLADADRLQEHAVLGEDRDAVIALVGDVNAPLRRGGDSLRIVELAVAFAAAREHALGLALRIDDGEEVVAGVDHGEAVGAKPGDAAGLLRLEGEVLAGEIDGARGVAGDAPHLAALALDPEDAAVGRHGQAAQVGERRLLGRLPGAQELDFGLLRGRPEGGKAEQPGDQRAARSRGILPRIASKQGASSPYHTHSNGRKHQQKTRSKSVVHCSTGAHYPIVGNRHHARHLCAISRRRSYRIRSAAPRPARAEDL